MAICSFDKPLAFSKIMSGILEKRYVKYILHELKMYKIISKERSITSLMLFLHYLSMCIQVVAILKLCTDYGTINKESSGKCIVKCNYLTNNEITCKKRS
jgi:hypothetical protein